MKKTNEQFMGVDTRVHDDLFNFYNIKEKNKKFMGGVKKFQRY